MSADGRRRRDREAGDDPPAGGVRAIAARILDRVRDTRAPADRFLAAARPSLSARDAALLHELVLGTLRWQARLDHVLEQAAGRRLDEIDPVLHNPLRLALLQLLSLDRVPAHAAVSEAVEEVRRRGAGRASGFANAVLRRVSRQPRWDAWPVRAADPVQRLAVEQSHPEWLVRRWLDRFGADQTGRLLAANNRPRRPGLLTFRDHGDRALVARRLVEEGVITRPSELSPLGLLVEEGDPVATEPFVGGTIYIQDAASQAAAWIPPPAAGERILDLAAAPGGKSFALLAWEPALDIVACDVSPGRLLTMRRNAARLARRIPLVAADATRPSLRGGFDRVVLDLPCAGTGTLRKHPELKWRLQPSEIGRLADQGLHLARAAAALLRPGGRLCLITCSIEPEENEDVVELLRSHDARLEPEPLADLLPSELAVHVHGAGGWRVLPATDHDGFTVRVLRRS
ncbi:MAG: RsmB/NOP family class I SAM-dependent RNA methyltransferase [Thermoanaerobaculia bacterium]